MVVEKMEIVFSGKHRMYDIMMSNFNLMENIDVKISFLFKTNFTTVWCIVSVDIKRFSE